MPVRLTARQTAQRLFLTAAGLAALLALQACSTIKLAYNQADTLLYWRLDGYADFTSEQAPRAREGLAQFLQWHRRTQLPAYADLLQRIRPQMAAAVSPEQACVMIDQVRGVFDPTLDPVHWPLVPLAAELSDEQLKQIERKQASTDADWRKEWLNVTPERLLETRFEQILSRSEMLYGSLDEPQQAAIRASLAVSAFDAQRSYAERLRRQQDLRQVLRKIRDEKLAPEPARTLLKAYMDRTQNSPDPAALAYGQTLIREACNTFSRLHNATTPAQRSRAMETLKRYEDDFRLLAAQR